MDDLTCLYTRLASLAYKHGKRSKLSHEVWFGSRFPRFRVGETGESDRVVIDLVNDLKHAVVLSTRTFSAGGSRSPRRERYDQGTFSCAPYKLFLRRYHRTLASLKNSPLTWQKPCSLEPLLISREHIVFAICLVMVSVLSWLILLSVFSLI